MYNTKNVKCVSGNCVLAVTVCMYTCVRVCVCVRKMYMHARIEEDPISTTLKVITLIKAVMCGDGVRGGEEGDGRGEPVIFYGAV